MCFPHTKKMKKDHVIFNMNETPANDPLLKLCTAICVVCAKGFETERDCVKHMTRHNELNLRICSKCKGDCSMMLNLQRHIEMEHGTEQLNIYKCPACTFSASSQADLSKHTDDVQDLPCHVCSKSFKTSFSLNEHIKTHNVGVSSVLKEVARCEQLEFESREFIAHLLQAHKNNMLILTAFFVYMKRMI